MAASLEARARHTDFSARPRMLSPLTSRGTSSCPLSAWCDAREYASVGAGISWVGNLCAWLAGEICIGGGPKTELFDDFLARYDLARL
jgi:hypothetical protein